MNIITVGIKVAINYGYTYICVLYITLNIYTKYYACRDCKSKLDL